MGNEYTCEICGKHLRATVMWTCVEDVAALQRGETITIGDHVHKLDIVPGDAIILTSKDDAGES